MTKPARTNCMSGCSSFSERKCVERKSFGNHKHRVKAHIGHDVLFASYNCFLSKMDKQTKVINLTYP